MSDSAPAANDDEPRGLGACPIPRQNQKEEYP